MMSECIFCRIVKGEIPCARIYESDNVLAFLDVMPVNKGHVLVIPKGHYETLLDIPEEILKEISSAVKKVAGAVKKGVGADGLNIMMNNYPAAGQEVPHAHIHIVPRFKADGLKLWPGSSYEKGVMEKTRQDIIDKL